MEKYDLVIFDCDGTLVVSEEINNRAISDATKKIGLKGYEPDICLQKFRGYSSSQIIDILRSENQNDFDEKAFIAEISKAANYLRSEIKAVKHVDLLMQKLKIAKCVVSNGERNSVIASLEQSNLLNYFASIDDIFTCLAGENAKPAPDMFLRAARKFSCPVNKVIIVEDSEAGVMAAKRANMTVIGFVGTALIKERRRRKLEQAGADYIIDDITKIIEIIN